MNEFISYAEASVLRNGRGREGNKCIQCGADISERQCQSLRCFDCINDAARAKTMQKLALMAANRAVVRGRLPRLDGSIACVDCGKPAKHYDHRDYAKPLDVDPVCVGCNIRRGPAKNHYRLD
jgi:hypothetical protein